MEQSRFRILEVIVVLGVLICGIAMFIPWWLKGQKGQAVRQVQQDLSKFTQAEEDFRANDLDRNGIADYWTRDVRGITAFRRSDGPVMISGHMGLADGTFSDCRSQGGWLFAQMAGMRGGERFDLGEGRGPTFAIHAYLESAKVGDESKRTFAMTSLRWVLYSVPGDGTRVSEMPPNPGPEGWGVVD